MLNVKSSIFFLLYYNCQYKWLTYPVDRGGWDEAGSNCSVLVYCSSSLRSPLTQNQLPSTQCPELEVIFNTPRGFSHFVHFCHEYFADFPRCWPEDQVELSVRWCVLPHIRPHIKSCVLHTTKLTILKNANIISII